MRLDRTRIAIVERRQPEILDLTFLVLREFFVPVVGLTLLLALPLAVANYFLIEWMAADLIEDSTVFRYLWTMAMLVYVEAPFAGILATAYLGKATFHETPTMAELCRDVSSLWYRIIWTQLIQRGVLLSLWLVWTIVQDDANAPFEFVLLPAFCAGLFLWRSLRPYINEIVLLEKSPIWSRSATEITIGKRSNRLHSPNSGDLIGRGVSMIPVTATLGLAVFGLIWFVVATFANDWGWGPFIVHIAIPAVFWILVIYVTVFRFLSYLDLRIRREGWEVELKMRAEANRINQTISP